MVITMPILYMGCSDVSEFEHIYGQVSTTPSCLYDPLFKWTRMMVVNALIAWKKLIDICFFFDKVKSFGIDSCLYEIPKNDCVDDMKLWPPITFPSCLLLPHRHAGRLHWGKAESIQLCDFRMGQVTTGAEAQFCLSFQRCVHRHSCWSQAKPARQ